MLPSELGRLALLQKLAVQGNAFGGSLLPSELGLLTVAQCSLASCPGGAAQLFACPVPFSVRELCTDTCGPPSSPQPVTCPNPALDFESLDGWALNATDGAVWTIHSNYAPTPYTGPEADHTSGTPAGKYALFEATDYGAGRVAAMQRDAPQQAAFVSLKFWYAPNNSETCPPPE